VSGAGLARHPAMLNNQRRLRDANQRR
jgi:hypothetical protein